MTTGIGDELDLLDIEEIHTRLAYGELTSEQLARRCLDRIAAYDQRVGAVIAVDPTALEQASQSDRRHADGDELGPLDGIPVLVKDSIDTAGLSSTAGSRLLAHDAGPSAGRRGCRPAARGWRGHPRQDKPERVVQFPVGPGY